MGPPWLRPTLLGIGPGFVAFFLAAAGFSPAVRAYAAKQAARHHVIVGIGRVRPTWFGVELKDVTVSPEGVDGASLGLRDIRLLWGWPFRLDHVEATGGALALRGPTSRLVQQLSTWASS